MNFDTPFLVATFSFEKIPTIIYPSAIEASKVIANEITENLPQRIITKMD